MAHRDAGEERMPSIVVRIDMTVDGDEAVGGLEHLSDERIWISPYSFPQW